MHKNSLFDPLFSRAVALYGGVSLVREASRRQTLVEPRCLTLTPCPFCSSCVFVAKILSKCPRGSIRALEQKILAKSLAWLFN